jgi:hypothetical protein
MSVTNNTVFLRVLSFGALALSSVIVAGQVVEICELSGDCSTRLVWLIICGAMSALISSCMAVASFILPRDGIIGTIATPVLGFLFFWWATGAGVAGSVRTPYGLGGLGQTVIGFAFFALFVAFTMVCTSGLYSCAHLSADISIYAGNGL